VTQKPEIDALNTLKGHMNEIFVETTMKKKTRYIYMKVDSWETELIVVFESTSL